MKECDSTAPHACDFLAGSLKTMCHWMWEVWIYWALNDTLVCLTEQINQLTKQNFSGVRIKTCTDPWTELWSTKSQNVLKGCYCFPAAPETLPQTSDLCFFQWYTQNDSVEVKSWSFNMPDLFVEVSVFPSETEWPWPSMWEENGNKIFPAVKLDWFSNHSLTDLTEAKGNGTFKHMDS